jgi:1-acyl-sn-glycerol-3-phosphate acyltransferase
MLYRITRLIMTITLRLFYRRIYATGIETIPEKGPVILLANHPSSLMDAAILGILLHRPIHYFTCGDVFKNKFVSPVFTALNMIPVFDHAGRTTLDNNDESFKKAAAILKKGGLILFFPEGSSHIDRKLMPFKKGAFRLAVTVAAELPSQTNLLMIPAGINYAHPFAAQHDVIVQVGDPVSVKEALNSYPAHEAAAILQLKKSMEKAVLKTVVHIEEETLLETADRCLEITRNDYSYYTTHWMQATRNRFDEEKILSNAINNISFTESAALQKLVADYDTALKAHHLNDQQLAGDPPSKSIRKKLVAGFPLFLLSYALNALPVLVARRIAEKYVKRVDFYSWVLLTTAALLYCCWIIILFLGFLVIGVRYALVITIITLALGPFTVFYINLRKANRAWQDYNRLLKSNSSRINELKMLRNRVREKLQQVVAGVSR